MRPPTEFTQLLAHARNGDRGAREQVFSAVYDELRRAAHGLERRGEAATLQPTALVHEAWFKLAPHLERFEGRTHFLAVAARAMRQVLSDYVKASRRDKRGGGGGATPITFVSDQLAASEDPFALCDCLDELATLNERHARVVEMRVFAGMTIEEVAEEVGVSTSTVELDWRMARAWLAHRMA